MMGWLPRLVSHGHHVAASSRQGVGSLQNRASVSRWYIHSRFHSMEVSVPPSKRRENLANLLNLEVRREILLVKETKQPVLQTQGTVPDLAS